MLLLNKYVLNKANDNNKKKTLTQQEALEKLRYYCAYQERCHAEVNQKLFELGVNKTDAGNIVVNLIENNFLNEERFAKAFAGGKFRVKAWGKKKIVNHLKNLKISDYCIKIALQEIETDDYQETLKKLAQKKLKEYSKYSKPIAKQKLIKYLVSKGYEFETILKAAEEVLKP